MDVKEKVKTILITALNIEAVSDDARREDYEEWDSLAYLCIVAGLEKEFDLQVTPENINNFDSIPNILKEIERARNNR